MSTLFPPKRCGGEPFRAVVLRHNERGGCNLCIGAKGYHPNSYVVLECTETERRQFPIGTEFDLVCVEETRGLACDTCGGAGIIPGRFETDGHYRTETSCPDCGGSAHCKGSGRRQVQS
jgi:hypothetical protein